jgi:hypothetical protein
MVKVKSAEQLLFVRLSTKPSNRKIFAKKAESFMTQLYKFRLKTLLTTINLKIPTVFFAFFQR